MSLGSLAARGAAQRAAAAPLRESKQEREAPAPVTMEKVGDFLELDFRRIFVWLRAGLMLALALALLGALAGGIYGFMAPKRYTVATDILINPGNLQVVDNDLFPQAGQIDSQVLVARSRQRVLTSRNVLSRVVDELHLADDPEFAPRTSDPATDRKLAALSKLQQDVNVRADEQSFVTTLLVTAETPGEAIELSQAIVKAFREELAETESEGANRAAAALDSRLSQMKQDVLAAEKNVEDYKRAHKLVSSNGQLVSSQSMTQLNTQILDARARLATAQANYDTLVAGGINGTNANPAVSPTLADLRNKANTAREQLNSLSVQLGPRHPSILKLKVTLDTINAQLRAEYQRTVDGAKANRDAAQISLNSLNAEMNKLQGAVFNAGDSEIALRELERESASKAAIYQRYLERTRQLNERERIDTTNVQVISAPTPPKGRSWPPSTKLLVVLGAIGGFGLGLLLALARGIRQDMRLPPDAPQLKTA
ncbi:cell shape-determining protein [Brucella endophytica]|uniref:Cell shape-determining protein n=1 Tax=Brucella endophytica TaxID=1963359 RepID=A0A916SPV1_9HYPH|nr:GumC family protein [Brucella endophytica]GGB07342.1 cell shape-determining protein [Brucella endophytica]